MGFHQSLLCSFLNLPWPTLNSSLWKQRLMLPCLSSFSQRHLFFLPRGPNDFILFWKPFKKCILSLCPPMFIPVMENWMGIGHSWIAVLVRGLWGKEEPKADQILVQKKTQDLLHQPFIYPNPTTVLRHSVLPPALQSCPWHFLNSYNIWYLYCIWKYSYLNACRMILFLFYPLYLPPDCKYLDDR